jgi:hypothetical protein
MSQQQLFPLLRPKVLGLLKGYVQSPASRANIVPWRVLPQLRGRAGVLGAIGGARECLYG